MKSELQRQFLISKRDYIHNMYIYCAMLWLIPLISLAIGTNANLPSDDFFKLWSQSQIFIYQHKSICDTFPQKQMVFNRNIHIGFGNLLTAKHVLTATSIFMKYGLYGFLKPDFDKYIFLQVTHFLLSIFN